MNQKYCSIDMAISLLKQGDVVAIPTETVYGLAGVISSESALRKIFEVKNRPFYDPIIVHIADIGVCAEICVEWPKAAEVLAEAFWPGPLTMVLKRHPRLNPLITAGLDSVGIRMPRHPLALDIIRRVGIPLAAPSANKFGKTSPSCAKHVLEEFRAEGVEVVDGGDCEVGLESTVIGIKDNSIEIFRPGMVSKEMIQSALVKSGIDSVISYKHSQVSPGHLKTHYMPKKPLVLVTDPDVQFGTMQANDVRDKLKLPGSRFCEVKLDSSPAIAARMLYSSLRDLSESDCDFLLAFMPKSASSVCDAIKDRLRRAASLVI